MTEPLANRSPGQVVAGILGAWFCFAIAVGVSGVFRNASAAAVALTVWGLAVLILLACWKVPLLRDWSRAVNFRRLIAIHLVRFVGIYFLVLGHRGDLPVGFAQPAGIGDIIIASGALFLLVTSNIPSWRTILRIWNFFGFIDIAFVAFNALRFGLQDWQPMAALRSLPLSLLPTFFVPLIIVSHVLIFARLISPAARETSSS